MKYIYRCKNCLEQFTIEGPMPKYCPYCNSVEITNKEIKHSPLPWKIIKFGAREVLAIVDADNNLICRGRGNIIRDDDKQFVVKAVNSYYKNTV